MSIITTSSGTTVTGNSTGYSNSSAVNTVFNSTGAYSTYIPTVKKPDFKEYKDILKNSERLQLTLKLFKKGNITLDEALELISTDIQFHREQAEATSFYGGWQHQGVTTITPYTTTTSNPYTITYSGDNVTTV